MAVLLALSLAGCCCGDPCCDTGQGAAFTAPADDAPPADAPPGPSGAESDGTPAIVGSGGSFDG